MAIVYKHIRKDTNEVFYIGIGNDIKRITSLHHRNPLWHNIVNKVGFDYEIIENNLTWQDACVMEKQLIKEYGRKNNNTGILVNMTDGGEGTVGIVRIHSNQTKEKIGNTLRGNKISEETKLKISEKLKGRIISDETRKKRSKALKGKPQKRTPEQYDKWRASMIGIKRNISPLSEEHRLKIKQVNSKPKTEEHKRKISEALKRKK